MPIYIDSTVDANKWNLISRRILEFNSSLLALINKWVKLVFRASWWITVRQCFHYCRTYFLRLKYIILPLLLLAQSHPLNKMSPNGVSDRMQVLVLTTLETTISISVAVQSNTAILNGDSAGVWITACSDVLEKLKTNLFNLFLQLELFSPR